MENKPTIQIYQPGSLSQEAFDNEVPPLYHYTNEAGFEGMLRSKSLWLSNIHDQNDTVEFTHAEDLVRQVISEDYPGVNLRGSIGGGLTGDRKTPIYTCSMSSAEDVLSQWRGYCHDGGVAYSIEKQQLLDMISRQRLMLAKCIYEEEDKKNLIRGLMGLTPQQYKYYNEYRRVNYPNEPPQHAILPDSPMNGKYMVHVRRSLAQYAAVMKHESFKEEQEWRLITYYDYRDEPNYAGIQAPSISDVFPYFIPRNTRVSGNRTIDYVELPLAYNKIENDEGVKMPYPHNPLSQRGFFPQSIPEGEVLISKVIISPTEHKAAAKTKWQQLMQGHGNVIVENSKIPYRTW